MKKTLLLGLVLATLFSSTAYSRDSSLKLSIKDAIESADFKEKLDPNIRFYFGKTSHPSVSQKFGSDVSNKKTNAFNKSDEGACRWALLSAMLAFQKKAQSLGANAVINVESFYKRNSFVSTTEFECHAGNILAGVAIKGDIVKLSR